MRNFVQSRRLKALFALVFLSFVSVDLKAQDTVTVEYSNTFVRGSEFCPGTDQFDDWETFLDSIRNLQSTGDFRFIEAKYNSEAGANSKTHTFEDPSNDIDGFITDLVGLDTLANGDGQTQFFMSNDGDQWAISSGCSNIGVGACALNATYPSISLAINPTNSVQCEADVESALRPFIGNKSWGGSFGDTLLLSGFSVTQSLSTEGDDEIISFSVRYVDAAPPIPVCFTDTIDIYLDGDGLFTLTSSHVDSASFDAFLNPDSIIGQGIDSFNLSSSKMNCDSLGARNIVLTLIDFAGNDSSCVTIINVIDTFPPSVDPLNKTLFLDASGQVSIQADSLVNIIDDNCGFGVTISLSDTLFTCTGVLNDTIFAVDPSGNKSFSIAQVTVLDTIAPVAICRTDTFEVYLDINGDATLVADSLNHNSTDNVTCSSLTFSADKTSFDCSDALFTDTSAIGGIEVILTVSDSSMNTDNCTAIIKVIDTIAPTSILHDTLVVYLDTFGVASIDSTMINNGSNDICGIGFIDLDTANFECASLDSAILSFVRVGDIFDNAVEDSVLYIVRDTIAPVLDLNDTIIAFLDGAGNFTLDSAAVDNNTQDNCGGFTLELGQTSFDCSEAGDTIMVMVTAKDLDEMVDSSMAMITLILRDTIAPVIVTTTLDTVYLDVTGNFMIHDTAFASATDICGIMSIVGNVDSVTCADVTGTPITVISTAMDSSMNTAIDSSMVLVLDTIKPTISLVNITAYLDANGLAILDSNAFDSMSDDACGIDSFMISMDTFNCDFINAANDSNVSVITTIVDNNGNTSSLSAQVTIMDTLAPVVVAMDTAVSLDINGMAIIDTSFILASVMDNCPSSLTFELSQDTMTCDDLFMVEVVISATDPQGNVGRDTATVTVRDEINPTAIAQNVTVYVDSMGQATLPSQFVTSNVDNGSSDNCTFVLTVSDSIFDCSQEGLNLVTLTATDLSGNTGTDEFFVTVDDTIKPKAQGRNVTIVLNDNGTVSIDPTIIDSNSWDNCMDNMSYALSQTNFDCSDLGMNTVQFSVQDGNGQADTVDVMVTIIDKTLPTAISQNITAHLDATGIVVITAADVNNGSVDNCGIDTMWLSKDTLTCNDLGVSPLTLYVMDTDSNVNSAAAIVTVLDTVAPVVMTSTVTLQLNSNGNVPAITAMDFDNGTTDNCGFTAEILSPIDYDCSHIGNNDVSLRFVDNSGNEVLTTGTLIIKDTIAPTALFNDYSVQLDAMGNAMVTPEMFDNGSNDNCSNAPISLQFANGFTGAVSCSDINAMDVVLVAQDTSLNTSDTITVTLTIEDVNAPVLNTVDTTLAIDNSGNLSVMASLFDNGTSDACGIKSMTVSPSTFTCTNLGLNALTFTATDSNDLVSTKTVYLTIEDDMDPVVMIDTVTLSLNSNGHVPAITAMDFDNGTTDNCGFTASILSAIDYDCTHIGTNNVSLRFVDNSGNEVLTTGILIIEDKLAPTALFSDLTVELDAMGNAMVTPAMFDNGTNDNCSDAPTLLFANGFTGNVSCSDVNAMDVLLVAQDSELNTSDTITVTLTIEDVNAPVLNTVDTTLAIDNSGNLVVMASLFDNGTSDACGIKSMTVSPTTFDCTNLGLNALTFTATDSNDLVSTKTVYLTIEDVMAPVVVIADVTLPLDANGNTPEVTAAMFDNGTSDNCEFTAEVLNPSDFDCSGLGSHVINLRYSDNSGNVVDTMANVIITDTIVPVAIAQNITAYIGENGTAVITPEMVNNGSTDNCDITLSLNNSSFACFLGGTTQNVVLTATDAAGLSSNAVAAITIKDSISPVVNIQAISRSLDGSGSVVVSASDFNNGTSDNCGGMSVSIDQTDFDCTHTGNNTIIFTATDAAGNTTEGITTLTISDDSLPNVIAKNITIQLNNAGNATLTPAMINDGSSDNCNFELSIDKSEFDCTNTGINMVTLTGTDASGNVSTAIAEVNVNDGVTPTINTLSTFSITLDSDGNASFEASELNLSSSDNCSDGDITFHFSNGFDGNLDCSDIDADGKPVYVFIKDAAGNISSTELTTVTIVDATAPEVIVNNLTKSLDASGNVTVTAADFDNGTNDACGIASLEVTPSSFDCSNVGVNTLTFTATDMNGLVSSQTVYLTVEDNDAPNVITQNINAELDANGNATITASMVDNGTTDNCNFSYVLDKTNFDCADLGAQTVTLTATDVNGKVSSETAIVTVVDNVNPTAIGQNLTVSLDATGNATITAAQVNNGSFDNCTSQPMTFALNNSTFDCTNVGANNVELSVTDASGKVGTTIVVVTVEETMAPVNNTINITRALDASGNVTVTAADFDNGSTDNCGIASTVINTTDFDCSNLGLNTVEFTTTDVNGNDNMTQVFITIEDNIAPVRASSYSPFGGGITKTIGECEADGFTYIYPVFEDNCEDNLVTISLVSGLPSGSIFPVGTTTITYIGTDASGNEGTITFTVIVEALGTPTDAPTSFSACIGGGELDLSTPNFTFSGNGVNGNMFDTDAAGVGSHNITWTWVDAYGCDVTGSVVVNVNPAANKPVISQTSSNALTAGGLGYSSYQWYKNGDLLTGKNAKTLGINTAGDYYVRAFTANGCSSLSDLFNIGGGSYNPIKGYDISETTIYPNPTTGTVNVDLGETLESVTIEVFDARGVKLKTFNFENMTTSEVKIQIGDLPSAMYHMVISSDVQVTTKKIVINK